MPLISSECETSMLRYFSLFVKYDSRRIDKGSILDNVTGISAGGYYGCNF